MRLPLPEPSANVTQTIHGMKIEKITVIFTPLHLITLSRDIVVISPSVVCLGAHFVGSNKVSAHSQY